MHADKVAESILSLVMERRRAASTSGDLMEEAREYGYAWLWLSVAGTAGAFLARQLRAEALKLAAAAALGWLAYMLVSLVVYFCGYVVLNLLWGVLYFLAHHTGLELLTRLARVRIDWAPLPHWVQHGMELLAILIAAPLQCGRSVAQFWRGRELAACLAIALAWPWMVVFVPFAMFSTRVGLPMLPVMLAFLLLGTLRERSSLSRDLPEPYQILRREE